MGRKKLSPNEGKKIRMEFRLDVLTEYKLRCLAGKTGVNKSEIIRQAIEKMEVEDIKTD